MALIWILLCLLLAELLFAVADMMAFTKLINNIKTDKEFLLWFTSSNREFRIAMRFGGALYLLLKQKLVKQKERNRRTKKEAEPQ